MNPLQMKNISSNTCRGIRFSIILFLTTTCYNVGAQHIQYRHKIKTVPVPETKKIVPVLDTISTVTMNKSAININPRPKKKFVEEQNMCNLLSLPELAPQLPVVINNVAPEIVKELKERYKGRLYSITKLNMIDERLKYKLKICDKDNGKFRTEYLDKDGNVITDPDLDYD